MTSANFDLKLNDNWYFHAGDIKRFGGVDHDTIYNACKAGGALGNVDVFLKENIWEKVRVPHDWLTSFPCDKTKTPSGGYKAREKGWYYCKFKLEDKPVQSAYLVFDGILGHSTVYVNGTVAMRNFSGYNRFFSEIGDYLIPGEENMIAVFVDASVWEGWWYEGAGLYRNAYIEFRENLRFEKDGYFIKPVLSDGEWKIEADINIDGLENEERVSLSVSVSDENEKEIQSVCVDANPKTSFSISVENPNLWSPESPYLYKVKCSLLRDGEAIDEIVSSVGFRDIVWTSDDGMYLNGERYRIKGICCHQDHAGVGAATTGTLSEFRIKKLKTMGANAYRCAHHAVTEEFLDLCDRYGIFVMAENRNFSVAEEEIKQLESMVKVSRNHPSVFIYSLFNEEPLQAETRGFKIAKKMYDRVKSLDSSRAVTAAMNGGVLTEKNASDILDVAGINYFLKDYDECHKRMPDKALIGTENCPVFATRGVYKTDLKKQIYASYGEDYPDYFAETLKETMQHIKSKRYAAGCFVWSGFDYRGEPQPLAWPSTISHWGMMDYCGFEKDIFYLLAAWYKDEPFVHILPHWNHKKGEKVRVCAFSNADTAEVFLNGKSQGKKDVVSGRAEWTVVFEEGTLSVCADANGTIVTDEVLTAGKAEKIYIEDVAPKPHKDNLHIVNVIAQDKSGTLVPDFCERIDFAVTDGTILGVGNGDPNSHHIDSESSIKFFNGKAQVIVESKDGILSAKCGKMIAEIDFKE